MNQTSLRPIYLSILMVLVFGCQEKQDSKEKSLRLITHNVYYGFTKIPERKQAWLSWMAEQEPDIVSLQELNQYTPEKLQSDANHWGHTYTLLLKEEGFPTGLTSRFPIEDIHRYTEGFHHGLIRAKIKNIYLYVIHLHPSNWSFRQQEIDEILKNITELPKNSQVILAGDFNTFSPVDSIFYQHRRLEPFFEGLDQRDHANNLHNGHLDYGVIEKVLNAGLKDMEYEFRPNNYHFTGSFPSWLDTEGEHGDLRRLDYIFVSPNLLRQVQNTRIIADSSTQYLSDHLPVIMNIDLP
ncbi:MAG: endonuclease/exonuclease/phosphatase family protein [Saprospiraceae bacterium]|nr:endonuclease/exonuclease/phosphatase family protein [Saprospiraceae bacterium]